MICEKCRNENMDVLISLAVTAAVRWNLRQEHEDLNYRIVYQLKHKLKKRF